MWQDFPLKEEMGFHLIIGSPYISIPVKYGRYFSWDRIIAVDLWTGEETEEFMADVLSHEFIHHLLFRDFSESAGFMLDNIRRTHPELMGNGVL